MPSHRSSSNLRSPPPAAATALAWGDLDPSRLLVRWPSERPVAALHSGGGLHGDSRWSIVAQPRRVATIPLSPPDHGLGTLSRSLDAIPIDRPETPPDGTPPFSGGWCVAFSYEMGRWFEPTARASRELAAEDDRGWPAAILAWCPELLAFDRKAAQWWWIGEGPPPEWVEELPRRAEPPATATLRSLRPDRPQHRFTEAVSRTIELIHAGDLFQANIAQRFGAALEGPSRAFAARALPASAAAFGAYLELTLETGDRGGERRAILSLSPERFLRVGGDGRIAAAPIKGTRPASAGEAELRDSPKDAAELAMIVDLMRNDLGRVCELGSVSVTEPRRIDRHPTLLHAVAEIEGRLRRGVTVRELLAATFPPGSVTGAPKIRAMQVIDELEPVERGPYCGAIGWIDRRFGAVLSVAIRTLMLRERVAGCWECDYLAGCGVVAESDPEAEGRESLVKTEVLRTLLG